MKSIHSCNDHEHEDDIELLSPPSTSNNNKLKVTTSTYTAVSCDDTTTSSIFHDDSKRSIKAHDEIVSFQSKCHIDDIPVEARGWTWSDPFYDTNDPSNHDIIAAFDIDRTLYDQPTVDLCKWWFLFLLVFAALKSVPEMLGAPPDLFPLFFIAYSFNLLMMFLIVVCVRSERRLRIKRTHIAIATRGIYLDEIDRTCPLLFVVNPWSNNKIRRTIVAYEEIKKVQIESNYDPLRGNLYYEITVSTNDDYPQYDKDSAGIVGYAPRHTLRWIENQQKFVDVVNAMMERHDNCVTALEIDVFPGADPNVATFAANDDSTLLLAADDELILYRSKCHADEIPEEARGLSWSDPIYNTNDRRINRDIIAAFDIDRTLYDRSTFSLCKWFLSIPIIILLMLAIFIKIGVPISDGWRIAFLIVSMIYGFTLAIGFFNLHVQRTDKKLRLHCMHIAISTRGIHIDEIDTASSIRLKRHRKVTFNDIESCQVASRGMITVCLKDKCRYRNGTFIGPRITQSIEGIQNQQQFVDIVNAMMRRRETRRVDDLSDPNYLPGPGGRW